MATYLSETESQNFYRLVSLLVDNGTVVLRKLLMKYAISQSTSLDQHLVTNKTKLENLKKRHVLTDSQIDLMFPVTGAADIEMFDITLISCLLNNICGKLPKQEKDEIQNLRNLRNKISGHMAKASVDGKDFKALWVNISQTITNLAQWCADPAFLQQVKDDINELWIRPKLKQTSQFSDLLLQWTLSEQEIIQEIETKHGKAMSEVNRKHQELKSDVEMKHMEIESKQDRLDKRTEALEKKLKKGRATRGSIDPERLRSSLLSTYEECYTSISVSPLFEKGDVPLDQLFTDVVIIEEKEATRETKRRNPVAKETIKVPVHSYKDVFYSKDRQGKVKSIFVLGQAGAGKTVYSQRIVNKWVKAHQSLKSQKANLGIPIAKKGFVKRTISQLTNLRRKVSKPTKENETSEPVKVKLDEDEELMSEFDFLFYVPLRHVKKTETLLDAVYQTVGEDKLNRDTTEYVFENCPESILVICDGLDEIDWFPSRHNFHLYTVVTTTRHWKYDALRNKSPRNDRILQLRGLGENGVTELAERLQSMYYNEQPASSVEIFLNEVKTLGLQTMLNESPLMLVYLLHVWYQKNTLFPSLTENLLSIIECILQRGTNKLVKENNLILNQDFSLQQEDMKGILFGPSCYKYGKLLITAAEIALKGLTNSTKEHTLVFSEADLGSIMAKKSTNVNACLKLGIISKSEKVHILHKEYNISFQHKLFQELFMALCLVNDESSLTDFYIYCNTLEKVLEMSNVFMLAAVLCPKTALQLSKHVVSICERDSYVLDFRSNIFTSGKLIRDLTVMYVNCVEECMKANPREKYELYLSDIYIDTHNDNDANWRALETLVQSNTSRLKSFYFTSSSDVTLSKNVLQQLQDVKSLTRLHIECILSETDKEVASSLNKVIADNKQLCSLHVECWLQLHYLPALQDLHHLYIRHVVTNNTLLDKLSELLVLGQLRTLQLFGRRIGDYYLDLSHLTKLYHLTLWSITMSSPAWWAMLETMNSLPALQELVLDTPRTTEPRHLPPPSDLHLSFVSRLHKLKLKNNGPSAILHHILHGVDKENQMRGLVVHWHDISASSLTSLIAAIPRLQHLEELDLLHIDTNSQSLSLDFNTNLKKLTLFRIKSSPSAWVEFFVSIRSLLQLSELEIDEVWIPSNVTIPKQLTVTHKSFNSSYDIHYLFCKKIERD